MSSHRAGTDLVDRENAVASAAVVRLATALGRVDTCTPVSGAEILVRAMREFTDAAAVLLVVGRNPADGGTAFLDSAPNALLTEDDVAVMVRAIEAQKPHEGTAAGAHLDLSADADMVALMERRGCGSARAIALGGCPRSQASLVVLATASPESVAMGDVALGLAKAVGSGLVGRFTADRDAAESREAAYARLAQHASSAAEVQDITGNGIAVAVGWLDALASGSLDIDERRKAADAAGRRLRLVQAAVNELVESTSRRLVEVEAPAPTDMSAVWREIHAFAAGVRGSGSPIVISRPTSLRHFLARSASILVPELNLADDRLRIELTDPVRLGLEGRTLLRASEGSVEQVRGRTFAVWKLAHPWR